AWLHEGLLDVEEDDDPPQPPSRRAATASGSPTAASRCVRRRCICAPSRVCARCPDVASRPGEHRKHRLTSDRTLIMSGIDRHRLRPVPALRNLPPAATTTVMGVIPILPPPPPRLARNALRDSTIPLTARSPFAHNGLSAHRTGDFTIH